MQVDMAQLEKQMAQDAEQFAAQLAGAAIAPDRGAVLAVIAAALFSLTQQLRLVRVELIQSRLAITQELRDINASLKAGR